MMLLWYLFICDVLVLGMEFDLVYCRIMVLFGSVGQWLVFFVILCFIYWLVCCFWVLYWLVVVVCGVSVFF